MKNVKGDIILAIIMYLKSLELHGFKSFAQKTVLDFLPPKEKKNSVTAVVGPNGSGKSNISDAIRWVMGEQSMKTLRGKKGEDIIFSGSEAKGQMGMVAVTMTLDNSDHRLNLDYEDIVITRRYYRSGESEYILNGNEVRLLDLQILLAKAQFGQGSYSVIGQGMIDRLLLQTPQERKDFFDEATGIKEFQIKRHQAALKLHRTKENINQAELLLQEVEPRLRTLSRQVKKLEQRQDVELKLREFQEQYYSTLYNYNQTQLDELSLELEKINLEYLTVNRNLTVVQEELAGLAKEESRQGIFENLQAAYQEIQKEKNRLEREKAVLSGKLQAEYSKVGKQNVGWLQNKIEDLKKEQIKLTSELTRAEEMADQSGDNIIKQKQKIEELLVARTELRGKLANLEQRLAQVKSEQSFFQFTGLKAVQAILEERQRLGNIYGAVAQLGEVAEKYQLALDIAAGGNLSSIVVDHDRTAQNAIEYLREHQLGVATFLPLSKIKPRMLSNDIAELKNRQGVHGLAVELVKFDSKFADIFSYVLGNTLIVDSIEVAREIGIGRVRMVTLAGDILEVSGSMKGGYRRAEKQRGLSFAQGNAPYLVQEGLLNGEEKAAELRKELDQSEITYEKAQENLRSLQAEAQIATSHADLLGRQKQESDKEVAALEQELSLYSMSPDQYDLAMKDLTIQKENLDKELEKIEKKSTQAEKKIHDFNQEEENKKQRIFALQEAMQDEQKKLNLIVDQKNIKQIEVAKLSTKQEDLGGEVFQEMHEALSSLVGRQVPEVAIDKLSEVQQQIQKLKYQLSLIGGIEEEVVEEYKVTKERHDFLITQLTDLKKAIEDLETMIGELDEIMKKTRDKAFKQIRKEFSRYFAILFEGGKADLVELYGEVEIENEENVLDVGDVQSVANDIAIEEVGEGKPKKKQEMLMGIDVIANPPGKKIKNVQMLSGGERTMTSIALVCAILHTNPSPFVVLDEVEAALDETNTIRFTKILQELAMQSQFILITHNNATMHAADALYGVTMGGEGVSHLLSVKLGEAEKISEEVKS